MHTNVQRLNLQRRYSLESILAWPVGRKKMNKATLSDKIYISVDKEKSTKIHSEANGCICRR